MTGAQFGLITSSGFWLLGVILITSGVRSVPPILDTTWAAHHCVGGSNPDACERNRASHAVYMLTQCTPLLVEKAGVTPEVNLRNLLCSGEKADKQGIHPGFETQGRRHQKSKTGVSVAAQKGPVCYRHFKNQKSRYDSHRFLYYVMYFPISCRFILFLQKNASKKICWS